MKKRYPKILIVPHYSGTESKSKVFKFVLTEQAKKKLEKMKQESTKDSTNENNSS